MVNLNPRLLIFADNISDKVPVISSASNLYDIFAKMAFVPPKTEPSNNPYIRHLRDKSYARCVILLLPFLGNIVVGLYDLANRKWNDSGYVSRAVRLNGLDFAKASSRLKGDNVIVNMAFCQNVDALQFATPELRNHGEFMRARIELKPQAAKYLGKELQENIRFIRYLLSKYPKAVKHILTACPALQNNKDFIVNIIKLDDRKILSRKTWKKIFLNNHLKDRDFVLDLLRNKPPKY